MTLSDGLKTDNGLGGAGTQTYTYEAQRAHRTGFGSRDLERLLVSDGGFISEQTGSQDWAIGFIIQRTNF